MKLIDLFCGAGGASMGYFQAGFDVTGVDLEPQPNYPFAFICADAFAVPLDGFDVVHASPPCQTFTQGARRWGTDQRHPNLIPALQAHLKGRTAVIENVIGARPYLVDPIMLCGEMFGLGVFRHRLFQVRDVPQPVHVRHTGVVGDGRFVTVAGHTGGSSSRDGWRGGSADAWRVAMGIDWMTARELAQAIPPAYTRYIGNYLVRNNGH